MLGLIRVQAVKWFGVGEQLVEGNGERLGAANASDVWPAVATHSPTDTSTCRSQCLFSV